MTDRRVTEMIELAVILTNHPATDEAKAALARIANEVLKKGADATIDQAIEAAPSCEIGQIIRHAAEAASERVVIYRNGVRAELLLFAIPILTMFEHNVPESQFESAVSGLNGLKDLIYSLKDDSAQMALLPKLFRLDDLNAMPLSIVRQCGINLGTGSMRPGSQWHSCAAHKGGFKRSTAFLRFLVGQRQVLAPEDCVARQDGLCEGLRDFTKHAVRRYLGLPCRVQAIYMNSFHNGVYSGMWLYQEKRLDQLARASCTQTRRKKSLQAWVVTYGCRHRFEMWVGFFVGTKAIGRHAFRLSSRPSDDPIACVSRIISRLEAADIKTNVLTGFVPEDIGFGIQTGRELDLSMIATPI